MKIKNKYSFFFFLTLFFVIAVLTAGVIVRRQFSTSNLADTITGLSQNLKNVNSLSRINISPTLPPATPTIFEYTVSINSLPDEITEGGLATFTWNVNGSNRTIKTTSIYYGTTANSGNLAKDVLPEKTNYTDFLKEYMNGAYNIPMVFVGNATLSKQGTYYARAYAKIDEKNYWSDERSFTVKPIPRHEIKLINYPEKIKLKDNAAFTWQITGPQTTTGYTVVVGAKESKSGTLDETMDLSKTPYRELVKDFTNGTYAVPLTYVGNTYMPEYGIYYVRALALINGKNIWSEEYTVSVE